jgi:hypothetical protein
MYEMHSVAFRVESRLSVQKLMQTIYGFIEGVKII